MVSTFFSIIIPAYNAEVYIKECICSLKKQTMQDFEIVIVDDGSTDNTLNVCYEHANKNPSMKIKIVHQANQRQIAARMNGVNHSCGEYCLFVDADDKLVETALEDIKKSIDKYEADIIIYNGLRFLDDNHTPFWSHYKKKETFLSGRDFEQFRYDALTTKRFNNVWNKAIRRKVILESACFKNVSYISIEEDYLMQLPWYDVAQSAVYLPKNLYLYRLNTNSITFQKFDKYKFDSAKFIFNVAMNYVIKWNVPNGETLIRRRFISSVSNAVKQFYTKQSGLNAIEKKNYLLQIANDNTFREEYKKFDGTINSKIGKIILWLLYHKCWRLSLFLAEHDPKIHGKDKSTFSYSH